ncbi:unnamed protein product [Gongylonema pulchrum]|uniref:Pex2_Pex12 domain-containing protein n=1 Tax=Gongylonema pulchrum TaxID=637853 RepID=A0A183DRD9_9BILA|nr:unnamed protein product [Gongylonema pulchrum]
MKPVGRSLNDLRKQQRRSVPSLRRSSSAYSSGSFKPLSSSADFFEDIEDLKSQLSPDGSLRYCWQHSQKEHLVKKLCLRLQCIYKKSRIHGAFPILILAAYSFFGGFIFYLIEYPHERLMLEEKKAYFEREKRSMHRLLLSIELVLHQIRANHSTNRYLLSKTIRIYQRFALNRIDKAVYWYVLNMYHLSDQETYRASILQPRADGCLISALTSAKCVLSKITQSRYHFRICIKLYTCG